MNKINLKITNQNKHISQTPEINSRFSNEKKTKLAKAARDFESMLTSMMLKSMTKTTSGLFGSDGFGGDYFDTIFEGQLASMMSKGNSFGISNQIYKKLTGEDISTLKTNDYASPKIKMSGDDNSPIKINKKLTPSIGSLNRLERYQGIIKSAAEKYGISENIIKSVILTESAANDKAVSNKNAKGLMQLMESTADDMGVKNIFDPKENILGGVKYLSRMFNQYDGDLQLALAAYNAGPGNVNKFNGIPPFKETKSYINRVLSYMNYLDG